MGCLPRVSVLLQAGVGGVPTAFPSDPSRAQGHGGWEMVIS